MRPKDRARAAQLEAGLLSFDKTHRPLPGIKDAGIRTVLVEQMLESIHRIQYVKLIRTRPIDGSRTDPTTDLFDPLKAALIHFRAGDADEAFWLVFLSVQFGKHAKDGWRLTRDVYGALGNAPWWTWRHTSSNLQGFKTWLGENYNTLKGDGTPRRFGSHRSYETLKVAGNRGTAAAVSSYVQWVGANRGHTKLFKDAEENSDRTPTGLFDDLYKDMSVSSFGRLGKFDYLTMIGKLGFVNIEPGSPYLRGATGPLRGANLLFKGNTDAGEDPATLDSWTIALGHHLDVSMQVMEDSLCNWQKSPNKFEAFRG